VTIVGSVANAAALPVSANVNDGYITQDDGHLHVWDGIQWNDVGIVRGPTGPEGPSAVSTDADNAAILGGDGLVYVPNIGIGEEVAIQSAPEPVAAGLDLWVNLDEPGISPVFTHSDLLGLGSDDHSQYHTDARGDARYAILGRTISAGNGLTGGGSLSANRTIDVGEGTGISVTADAVSLDTGYTDARYIQHTESEAVISSTSPASGTPAGGTGTVWVQY